MSIVRWRRVRRWTAAVITHALVAGQLLIGVPAFAAPKDTKAAKPAPAPEAPKVKVNRTLPVVKPVPEYPIFSENPTTEEIRRARVFGEPLLPIGEASFEENKALTDAVTTWLHSGQTEDLGVLEAFLASHPQSAWRPSLLLNVGISYRRAGRYAKALAALEEVWSHGQAPTGPVGDRALEDLIELYMKFDPSGRLASLLKESKGRDVGGPTAQKIRDGEQAVWVMNEHHDWAIPSGPLALDKVLQQLRPGYVRHPKIAAFKATHDGASVVQIRDLAQSAGLSMQIAQWEPGAQIPIPSVAHYKLGHYTAIIAEANGKYLLDDPILDGPLWVSRQALEEEASGYFLVPAEKLPDGFRLGDEKVAAKLRGKCHLATPYPGALGTGSPGTNPDCHRGMAGYTLRSMLVDVNISDTPVGYSPPIGPAVDFTVDYNDRELLQPKTFYFSNLGSQWTFNWMSWVTDDPANPSGPAQVYLRQAGQEAFSGFDPSTGSYTRWPQSQAQLVRTSSSPVRYERRLSDGSVEVFSLPDGAATSPRRVFLTQLIDPQGNALTFTYDNLFRLVAVQDAIGQVTTLSYDFSSDPLKITKVTDPFGRSAAFEYNAAGQLTAIVDVIGLRSQLTYGDSNFVSALTTPYGTTRFQRMDDVNWRKIEVTDPLGGVEHMEGTALDGGVTPASEPASVVPTGFAGDNGALQTRNTYYWDKLAWSRAPGDYTKARVTHWRWGRSQLDVEDVIASEKPPLENRIWYGQTGENQPDGIGPVAKPSRIGRVLDDGTSQISRFEYSASGRTTRATDPVGRTTIYVYGSNNTPDSDQANGTGQDLLQIKQVNGQSTDLIASYTYNSQHQILTRQDAAGQVTTYTYSPVGQLLTVSTPPRAGITEHRTTTYTYNPDGTIQSVTGPDSAATISSTYDAYGRLRTSTDADNYTLTYDYDNLDRLVKTTFPDTTYEQTTYDRLDARDHRDRLGRWSHTFYDALRRPITKVDALGRTTTQQWCSCGSLDKLLDGNGNTTSWTRDVQGRVTQETRADNATWTYIYENTTSRQKSITDAKNQTKTFTYAKDNAVISIIYANAQVPTANVSFTYDTAYSRLLTMVDGLGTTTYAYVPVGTLGAGNLATIAGTLPSSAITYGYDELGRVISRKVNGNASSIDYTYDALGRLATETNLLGTFTWGYDGPTGRTATLAYPNGQTSIYIYFDNSNEHRLQTIWHKTLGGGTLWKGDYAYNLAGDILTWSQQYGSNPAKVWNFSYDAADQLTGATIIGPNPLPIPSRYAWAYDKAGNRIAEQKDDAVLGVTYNSRNELVSQQPGGALLFKGSVSEPATINIGSTNASVAANGQFGASVPVPSGTNNVTVTARDYSGNARTNTYQIGQSGPATSFTYDTNGNMTSDGTKTYTWDAENRLASVMQGSTTLVAFAYDGRGRRVQAISGGVTHTYLQDGNHVSEERLSGGRTGTVRYFHSLGVDSWLGRQDVDTTPTYIVPDHLGSIVQETNASNGTIVTRSYDAWGVPDPSNATLDGIAYTGRDWDNGLGAYYYRARYYDPVRAHFLSEDPLPVLRRRTNYTYAENNPIRFKDPTGLIAWECHVGIQSVAMPFGGAHIVADCYSECVNGRKIHQLLTGLGAGGSLSPLEYGNSIFPITMHDSFLAPMTISLPGLFTYAAVGGTLVVGYSYTWGLTLGSAYGSGFGWQGGIDPVSADAYSGFTVPVQTEKLCCSGNCPTMF